MLSSLTSVLQALQVAQRRRLALALLLMLSVGLFEGVGVAGLYLLFGSEKSPDGVLPTPTVWLGAAALLLLLARQAAAQTLAILLVRFDTDYVGRLRKRLFGRFVHSPWQRLSRQKGGAFTAVLSSEADRVGGGLQSLLQLLADLLLFAAYGCVAVLLQGWGTLFALLGLAALFTLVATRSRRFQQQGDAVSAAYESFYEALESSWSGMKLTKAERQEERVSVRLVNRIDRLARLHADFGVCQARSRFWFDAILAISMAGLGALAWLWGLSTAAVVLLVLVVIRFSPRLGGALRSVQNIAYMMGALSRIEKICDWTPEDSGGNHSFEGPVTIIRCENLTYAHQENPALNGLNIEFRRGMINAVVGPSGAGKTTLIDLVAGLIEPQDGVIEVNSQWRLKQLTRCSWAAQLSYVGQQEPLLDMSLQENLTHGISDAEQVRVLALMDRLGLNDLIPRLEQRVGHGGVKLSAGERQRVALIRGLLRDPQVMLLDEVTSALDPVSEDRVRLLLEEIKHRVLIVLVSHRLSTIRGAANVVVLEQGMAVENGRWEELIGRSGSRLNRLAAIQSHVTPPAAPQ